MKGIPKILQLIADNASKGAKYSIEAKGDSATIYAYGVIGDYYGGIDETQFAKDVAALKVSNIDLRVNSPGGDVFAARAMMTAIAAHPAKVTAYIDGLAASAATSLIMAADRVVMTRGARMMIHEAWTLALGNKGDMRAQADILDGIDAEIVADYSKRTGKSDKDLAAMMASETWFNADQAKEAGFVDEIVEATKGAANAANKWNLSAFKNAPTDLTENKPDPAEAMREHRARAERAFRVIEKA